MTISKQPHEFFRQFLFLGLAVVSTVCGIFALHFISPRLPGTAGTVFKNNMEQNINAEALFYTEVGDVSEFLNQETGRYGIDLGMSILKPAEALKDHHNRNAMKP